MSNLNSNIIRFENYQQVPKTKTFYKLSIDKKVFKKSNISITIHKEEFGVNVKKIRNKIGKILC